MIGWLQGQRVEVWKQGNRHAVIIGCAGVGYEVQVVPRHLNGMETTDTLTLWIHHVQREDAAHLFGFPDRRCRDLFRTLISVSGVGPQMGIALMDQCPVNELIDAIVQGDLRTLCRAQGVGKRTAERLAVELRAKLADLCDNEPGLSLVDLGDRESVTLNQDGLQDLQATLLALGYEDLEIRRAVRAVSSGSVPDSGSSSGNPPPATDRDAWLRASLRWLSMEPA